MRDARLYVISSGYDTPRNVNDSSVHYVGVLDDRQLQAYIAQCAGISYVNAFEETFGSHGSHRRATGHSTIFDV